MKEEEGRRKEESGEKRKKTGKIVETYGRTVLGRLAGDG